MLLHQYSQALGLFWHESLLEQSALFWVIFVLSTAVTQISMLNMLIALMGNTYDKVTAQKQVYATRSKLRILAENSSFLSESASEKQYLYALKAMNDDEELEDVLEWRGTIGEIKSENQRQLRRI